MYRNKKNLLVVGLWVAVFYGASMLLLTNYTLGDQVHYWRFYEALSTANAADVMLLAGRHVSSNEPLSAYVLWMGARLGVEKNTFITGLNIILLFGILLFIGRHKVPYYVYLLIFSNFYLIVLMTGAERLKISYIFLIYAALIPRKLGLTLALASPLAHLQSLILLGGLGASALSRNVRSLFSSMRMKKPTLASVVLAAATMVLSVLMLREGIVSKASIYMSKGGGLSELIPLSLLAGVSFLATKDRLRMGLMLTAMMVAIYFLGGMRVNMIAFSLFIYFMTLEGRLHHPLVLALLTYLSLKSVFFVKNIFVYGHGFGGWLL